MKGIIMFDNLNDLVFFDADDELYNHLQRLALKDGLLEMLSFIKIDGTVDKNVVMQLFSPLIASYKVMQAQFGNKYKYIESEDGVLLMFNEILNYIVISISPKEDNLEETQKELSLFLILVELLYGPSINMIKNSIPSCYENISRSKFLSVVLNKWRDLKMEKQMFLVEAIERLIINQDITAMCINLLQEILEKIRQSHKDATYSHAFALVDTKLLALYSSRNSEQLPKETLLLLILIAQALKSPVSLGDSENDEHDEFFIPITSTLSDKDGSKDRSKNLKKTKLEDALQFDKYKKCTQTLLVYVRSRTGPLVPHILYVIEVTPKITLVLLSELSSMGRIASLISSLVVSLNNLQNHPGSRKPQISFETIEKDLKCLIDVLCKSKEVSEKEKHVKKLIIKWEQLKHWDLEEFFQMPNEKSVDPRLDSAISSMCELLRNLFEEMIARPSLEYEKITWGPDYQDTLALIQKLSVKRMADIADFLEVKALQNLTMSSYITEYPGLVHFIYIDRSCDYLIAPAISPRKGHLNGTHSLKKKIWKMVDVGRRYLDGVNKFCCLWKDDDLYFFYTIWFENSMGQTIKPSTYLDTKKFPLKGIICGNFFKKLVRDCFPDLPSEQILCYELFCVHVGSTPTEKIVEQSRRLSSQLWDFTGAYQVSLDLL